MSGLTTEQINALLSPLHPGRIRSRDGNSHLEAWDVRRWLLRIFGWGGWDFTLVSTEVVSERSKWDENDMLKGRHTVVYRVIGRLTIKDSEGHTVAVYEDGATGDGINMPSLHKAHDFALKTAMSQALKRCAVNLGDQFGLSLYNGGTSEPVVGRSAAHPATDQHEARDEVRDGELDDELAGDPQQADPQAEAVARLAESPVTVPPSVTEEGAAPPPDSQEAQDSPPAPDPGVAVGVLREHVIEALKMSRREATQALTRLSIQAAKDKLMEQPTHTPLGEPCTVKVLLDTATKHVARGAA